MKKKRILIIAAALSACALTVGYFRLRERRNDAAVRGLVRADQSHFLRELAFEGQHRKVVLKEAEALRFVAKALPRSRQHAANGGLLYTATFTVGDGQRIVCPITVRSDGKELVLLVSSPDGNGGDPTSFGLEFGSDIPPSLAKTIEYLLMTSDSLAENNLTIE